MLSDSESSDSDNGIRFKTASTRNKETYSTHSTHSNGNRYDSWRSSRDDRLDSKDRRSHNDRRSRRSESRDRRRIRSTSRDRNSSRTSDRRRSRSRDRIRDDRKRDEKPIKIPKELSRSLSVEKPVVINLLDDKSIDKHKAKKSKHKKHKRSKRDEKDDNGKETSRSLDRDMIVNTDTKPNIDIKRSSTTPKSSSASADKSLETNTKKHGINSSEKDTAICGPSLPPHLKDGRTKTTDRSEKSAIPKSKENIKTSTTTELPPSSSSSKRKYESSNTSSRNVKKVIGPSVPPPQFLDQQDFVMSDISETEDDDLIGPLPVGLVKSEAHLELEKRALEMKLAKFNDNEQKHKSNTREEWMIELPEVKTVANLGLAPRQFRTKDRPDMSDRSSWTDTPRDKDRKSHRRPPTIEELRIAKQKEANALFNAKRDAEQEEAARKHKKKHKRDESLIEIHQKKMKKKKEKEDERPSRRPFSRDTDLKVNRFDQAQKNAILKKAQLLDTRFGSGETKYL